MTLHEAVAARRGADACTLLRLVALPERDDVSTAAAAAAAAATGEKGMTQRRSRKG